MQDTSQTATYWGLEMKTGLPEEKGNPLTGKQGETQTERETGN